ncbi:MAG: TerB family tellurite resistance protein [Streptomycetales bacterium]
MGTGRAIRVRRRVPEAGRFPCPRCGGDREYRLHTRRWAGLVPVGETGPAVVCLGCGSRFADAALGRPTVADLSRMLRAATFALVLAVLRQGGWAQQAARWRAVEALRAAGLGDYDDEELCVDLAVFPTGRAVVVGLLEQLTEHLAPEGRETLLGRAAGVALADGALSGRERMVLCTAGQALGMTPVHVEGVLVVAERCAGSRPD